MKQIIRKNKHILLNNGLILVVTWLTCLAIRLSFSPLLYLDPFPGVFLLINRQLKGVNGFLFIASQFFCFDYLTNTLGIWTLLIAIAYGTIEFGLNHYVKQHHYTIWNGLLYTAIAVLSFDCIGMAIGPLFFQQPILSAVLGQIPFTLEHLVRASIFTTALNMLIQTNKVNFHQDITLKNKTI
ncbi:hypothetical protein HOM50_01685 [bacterium]|jgi:hypothetical protein|nr:hypothetical protein [bacterium]MBT5015098.1 hypothetical protein [bacterium]